MFRSVSTLLALSLLGALPLRGVGAATRVPVITAQPASAQGNLRLEGTVQPVREAVLAAQVSGTVVQLSVQAGQSVRAGQALLRIDDRTTQASVAQSDGGVAQAQAIELQARQHLQRTRDLKSQGFVSAAALDTAQAQWQAARAGLQAAQAGQQQARLQQQHTQPVAPFDGIVQATHVNVGDLAQPGRPLVSMYAPGALRAVVQVPASLKDLAMAARDIRVHLPGRMATTVTPVRHELLPATDLVSQTAEWRLDLPVSVGANWRPGQAVSVQFSTLPEAASTPRGSVIRLPGAAVLRRGELTAVYVARQGQFQLQPVRVRRAGAPDGSVDVLSGLKVGDRVAADAIRAGLQGAQPEGQ